MTDIYVVRADAIERTETGNSGADMVGATPQTGLDNPDGTPADSVMEQLRAVANDSRLHTRKHDLFSSDHPDVDAADVPAANDVLTFNGTKWNAAPAPGGATDAAPIGSGKMWFGSTDPAGGKWFICDGRAISRTTYVDLFNVMGTAYGAGDGSTTFNIPDLRARTPIGANAATTLTGRSTRTRGDAPGAETHTLSTAEIPPHAHVTHATLTTNTTTTGAAQRLSALTNPANSQSSGFTSTDGGSGGAHNNMQPSLAVNFILRVAA